MYGCTFIGTGGYNNGGIALFNNNSENLNCRVQISNCVFTGVGNGVQFADDNTQKLDMIVSNNQFSVSGMGIYGVLTDMQINGNTFADALYSGIEMVLRSNNQDSRVVITNNVIDSGMGIRILPYYLNPGNGKGDGDTVLVTSEMLPEIAGNIRNVDNVLVVVQAYHDATDELLYLEPGAIDVQYNYTAGTEPQVEINYPDSVDFNEDLVAEVMAQNESSVINDVYYIDSEMSTTNIEAEMPDTGFDDDESLPPFIPQQQDNSDDTTLYVACCAAAAFVALLAVVLVMNERKR